MPNVATISVIIKTKDAIKQMIQGWQHTNMFQNITYKYFLMLVAKISMEVTSFSLPEDYYMRTKLST